MHPNTRSPWYPLILFGVDAVLVAFGLWLCYALRFQAGIVPVVQGYDPQVYLRAWPLITIFFLISFAFARLYDHGRKTFDIEVFHRVSSGTFLAIALALCAEFFLRRSTSYSYSRAVTVIMPFSVVGSVCLGRYYLSQWLISRRIAGVDVHRTVIVGVRRAAAALAQRIADNPQFGLQAVGFVEENGGDLPASDETLTRPRLGRLADLPRILREHRADLVIVASPHVPHSDLVHIFHQCEEQFVGCKIAPDLFEILLRDMETETLAGIPLLSLKETPLQGWNFIFKRLFDVAASLALLVILAPVSLVIAVMIKLESRGPVLYRQERMGLDGRTFRMVKFRSMHRRAEAKTGPVWAADRDARRTRVGRLIRAFNFDELPQLINVLRGTMSLVGPRPERPFFIEQFRDQLPRYMARHRVRAGMTGWAQVNGLRGNTSITDRLKYDLFYVENWSFWFDIKIILMTMGGSRRPPRPVSSEPESP